MKALILAGGHGTRLHPLTMRTPKCLLPIAGKPNILYMIELLEKAGIRDIYVSINDRQLKINDFLKDRAVNLIIENQENGKLGSIGGLNYAVNKIGEDNIIVLGADNFLHGLDLKSFSKNIREDSALLALYNLPEKYMVELFGIAELNGEVITSFQEKPRMEEAKSMLGSTLIYGLGKEWIKNKLPVYIRNNKNLDTIGSMWQYFCTKDTLYGFTFKGLWADIGNARAYVELNNKIMNERRIHKNVAIGEGTKINGNVIIEDGCEIGKNCVINQGTHIMHGTKIDDGAVISNSIIFENAKIGKNSAISKSIIDGYATIGDNVRIHDYCIVGYKSTISNNSTLIKNSKVWPFLKAEGVIDGNVVFIKDETDLTKSKYWC